MVLYTVLNFFNTSKIEKSSQIFDTAISVINNINYITNESDKSKYYQEQVNNLNSLIQLYPDTVPAMRARLFLGKLYYESAYRSGKQEAINQSVNYYSGVLVLSKSDFYKSLAAIGLAYCYEQKNDFIKAFENFNLVLTKYPNEGFNEVALIGMARAKEMQGDVNNAIVFYKKVVSEYTNSLWTKYAKGKIFYFSGPGNLKEVPVNAQTNKPTNTSVPFILPK